jgi:hypothetical protein
METYTWANLISAGKKVPTTFEENTLQVLYDDVSILKNNMPNTDLFNVSSWETVFLAANMIPSTFNSNTLQQMYTNINDLMSGGSGSGGSGSSSSTDYGKDIEALQTAVQKIPSTFDTTTLQLIYDSVNEMLYKFSYIPNKNTFNVNTWIEVTNAVSMIPELQ